MRMSQLPIKSLEDSIVDAIHWSHHKKYWHTTTALILVVALLPKQSTQSSGWTLAWWWCGSVGTAMMHW